MFKIDPAGGFCEFYEDLSPLKIMYLECIHVAHTPVILVHSFLSTTPELNNRPAIWPKFKQLLNIFWPDL